MCYFVLFYILICRYMTKILSRHDEINKSILKFRYASSKDCGTCFVRYDTLTTFKLINSMLAFPVFLDRSFHACDILFVALNLLRYKTIFLRFVSLFATCFALFTGITLAASSVNQTDKLAKEANVDTLKLGSALWSF